MQPLLAHAQLVGQLARVAGVPAALLDRGADLRGAEAELLRQRSGERLRPAEAGPVRAALGADVLERLLDLGGVDAERVGEPLGEVVLALGGDVLERRAQFVLVDPEAVREALEAWS